MGIINVLDFKVANLIAAGEVVDRPASVIKELMENSIDAGSSSLTVEIQNGGVSFMRVADNGRGMSRDDVPVSIKRHATSKIKYADDLDGIVTLGFRGEALAAIASVCKMRVMTKRIEDSMGTCLLSENGDIIEIVDMGNHDGTTVICEELFANVPARRKFLKSNAAETAAVTAVVEKVALSRSDIAVKYISDNVMKFNTAGDGKLMNTVYSVLGKDFAKKLIEVRSITDGIEVTGFIGSPEYVRGNRNYQNFFINERYIKSKTAMAALEQAFNSFIPSDKFPACILDIKVHPAYVDVNVHPAKLEVKFSDEKVIFNAVYCAVRNALTNKIKRPEMDIKTDSILTNLSDDVKLINTFIPIDDGFNTKINSKSSPIKDIKIIEERIYNPPDIEFELPPPVIDTKPERVSIEKTDKTETKKEKNPAILPLPKYKIIGEAFYAYVMVEIDECVMMIDKHAAHERIIFEEMKRNRKNASAMAQVLILPIEISLSPDEHAALIEFDTDIRAIGFDYELTGDSAKIFQIPTEVESEAAGDVLTVLAGNLAASLSSVGVSRDALYEKALYQASCKAAVKAGHDENIEHIRWIIEKVLTIPDIKFCPHGRPVAFELTKHDIERQFKRI